MRKLICATAAALVLGATGAAAGYDYVDAKGYRHWDHTGTDATEKPAASATLKVSKRRPAIHKTASKPLVTHGTLPKAAIKPLVTRRTLPVVHAKSGDESPEAKAGGDALFDEFQEFLFATTPVAVDPPKREPTPEPQPAGNDGHDYVDAKRYRHWDNTGTDATEKPAASATRKVTKRHPAIHKTASKPLITHGTPPKTAFKPLVTYRMPPVGQAKSGDESPKAKADRDALFQEFQENLFATKPVAVEPPKSEEPTPEPRPAGNDGQQKSKTETADTATHAISAPELGGSATLPNGKGAPAVVQRQDFAPSSVAPSLQPQKSGPPSLPPQTAQDGQQKSKTETADSATHAISAPELGGSATLPNGKDAPAVVRRQDFGPSSVAPSFQPQKSGPPSLPPQTAQDGQQKSKTKTAHTATYAISAPEPGGSATRPNGNDAPAATTLVSREDFAPSSNVVVPDKVAELFFHEGAKIIELLQATGYSDYAPHEIPPEVIALEPALAMFRFVKRPEGDIGLVSGLSDRTLGILK